MIVSTVIKIPADDCFSRPIDPALLVYFSEFSKLPKVFVSYNLLCSYFIVSFKSVFEPCGNKRAAVFLKISLNFDSPILEYLGKNSTPVTY